MNQPDTAQEQNPRNDPPKLRKPSQNSNPAALGRISEERRQAMQNARQSNPASLGRISEDRRQAMQAEMRAKNQKMMRTGIIAGGILLVAALVIFLATRPKAPVVISDVGFYVTQNTSAYNLYDFRSDFEVKNTSDQKITYIDFKVYYYDKDGNYLYQKDKHYSDLINIGEVKSLFIEENYMPFRGEAVMLPKEVTVTFVDGKQAACVNKVYGATRTYTGKKLKDKT